MDDLERRLRTGPVRTRPDVDLVARAKEEGLLDVAVAELDSPIGSLLLARTPVGLVRISFPGEHREDVFEWLARRVSPRLLESQAELDDERRQLDEYFAGRRHDFDLELDWSTVSGFGRRVLDACAAIPYGVTDTYSGLAAHIGSPRAARAVGNALGANPIPVVVPCHRVLHVGGGLGGYGGGLPTKEHLLRLEGALAL
jgi:methylated-DNA-[protein]-cysteine S-methyltransferase